MSRWFGNSSTRATVVDAQFVEYVDDDAVQKSACNQPASAIERRIAEQVAEITKIRTSVLEMTIDSVIVNFDICEITNGKIWVILHHNCNESHTPNIKYIDVDRLIRCARKHGCTSYCTWWFKPCARPFLRGTLHHGHLLLLVFVFRKPHSG